MDMLRRARRTRRSAYRSASQQKLSNGANVAGHGTSILPDGADDSCDPSVQPGKPGAQPGTVVAATAGHGLPNPAGGLSSAQVAERAARQGRPEAGDGHLRADRIRSRCRGHRLQALRDQVRAQPGQQALITGASGGVGTFAVQIAKVLGTEITGACSTSNAGLVKSIGADAVIDYTRDDSTRGPQRFDVIVDNVAIIRCRSAAAY
jgi:Zinc-binding dehydrogenase